MAIEVRDSIEGKVCSKCVWKPINEFYKDRTQYDGHYHQCKTCELARKLHPNKLCAKCNRRRGDFKDYGGHLDEEFGKHKSYCLLCLSVFNKNAKDYPSKKRGAEKRRALEAGLDGVDRGHCHPYEWELFLLAYGKQCLYPGCDRTDIANDHIIPHSKGGSNELWNRQSLCITHNSAKNNRDNTDYRPDQGKLAMLIHNLRIGQHTDKKIKKQYYDWVIKELNTSGIQKLHSLIDIFIWEELRKENN